jgi:hypothetical protein
MNRKIRTKLGDWDLIGEKKSKNVSFMPGHSDLMRGHFDRAKQPLDVDQIGPMHPENVGLTR